MQYEDSCRSGTEKKITLSSARAANLTDTPKVTAPVRMFVLSVGANTIRPCAQKTLQPLARVFYVAGTIQRVTKDALYTKIYSKHGVKPITQYTQQLSDSYYPSQHQWCTKISPLPRTLHPATTPKPLPNSYSRIVTHHQQPTDMTETLSKFLDEFRTMFNQLIQQNSMILNMLSTVIHIRVVTN
jgi:hypothetical protein